jgi:hypothetical protein
VEVASPYFCLPPDFDLTIDKTEKLTSRKVESVFDTLDLKEAKALLDELGA